MSGWVARQTARNLEYAENSNTHCTLAVLASMLLVTCLSVKMEKLNRAVVSTHIGRLNYGSVDDGSGDRHVGPHESGTRACVR